MNPTPVVLYGDAVKLEPLDPAHAQDLLAAGADPDIWRFMPIAQPNSVAEVTRWIDEAWQLASLGDQLPFAIVDPGTDRAVAPRFSYPPQRRPGDGWTWMAARCRHGWNNDANSAAQACVETGALGCSSPDARNLRAQQARSDRRGEEVYPEAGVNHDGSVRDAV